MLSLNDEQMLSLTDEQMTMLQDAQALLPNEAARGRFMKIFEVRVMSKRPRLIKPDNYQVHEAINFGLSEVGAAVGRAVLNQHPNNRRDNNGNHNTATTPRPSPRR